MVKNSRPNKTGKSKFYNRKSWFFAAVTIVLLAVGLIFKDYRPAFLEPLVALVPAKAKIEIKKMLGISSDMKLSPQVIISTNGHPLQLKPTDNIYIFQTEKTGIQIDAYNNMKEEKCFSQFYVDNNITIPISEFSDCNLSIIPLDVTVVGENISKKSFILASKSTAYSSSITFHNAINDFSDERKILFVLPTTNWFFYDGTPTRYFNPNGFVHLEIDKIRLKEKDSWLKRSIASAKATAEILNLRAVELGHDFQLNEIDPSRYELVVLLLHTEYTTKDFLIRVREFVDSGGKLLLLGGAPLQREVSFFDNEDVIITPSFTNHNDFDIPSFDKEHFYLIGGDACFYSDNTFSKPLKNTITWNKGDDGYEITKQHTVGEIVKLFPVYNVFQSKSVSYSNCGTTITPNIVSSCYQSGGCIVSITSDGIAEYLNLINDKDAVLLKTLLDLN